MSETAYLSPYLDGNCSVEERTRALNNLAQHTMTSTRNYFRGYSLTYNECEKLARAREIPLASSYGDESAVARRRHRTCWSRWSS